MTTATTQKGERALAEFRAALEVVAVDIEVAPGMMVFIPNTSTLHGRGAFSDAFGPDGEPQRWVQRVFWANTLSRYDDWAKTSDRVFDPSRPA